MKTKSKIPLVGALAAGALVLPLVAVGPASAADTPFVQVSLGDSLTRAAAVGGGTLGSPLNNELANWSTGTDSRVPSHLQKIQAATGDPVTRKNLSVGGSKVAALLGQAEKAPTNTTYATILSGGNDVCQASSLEKMPSVDYYKTNMNAAISKLKSRSPQVKIFLSSIPNVVGLHELGKVDATAKAVYASNRVCALGLGNVAGETTAQAEVRRAAVDGRIQAYNNALKEIAATTSNVAYDGGATYNIKSTIDDISTADYFHPSYAGQKKVAEATWGAVVASGLLSGNGIGGGTVIPTPTPTNPTTPTPTPTTPTTPVATVNFTLVQPTATVSGSTKLVATVTSNETITKVVAKVKGYSGMVELKKAAGDGKYYSPSIDSTNFSNGVQQVDFVVTLSSGTTKTFTKTITVNN